MTRRRGIMASRASLCLLAALAGACTSPPDPTPRHLRHSQVEAALQSAAQQVRRCYRAPRVSSGGRQIITRLRVRLTPEGELAQLPILLDQTGITSGNRAYAEPMAEAAIGAVMRCAPLRLPPALYVNGWSDFDLTFSPMAVA